MKKRPLFVVSQAALLLSVLSGLALPFDRSTSADFTGILSAFPQEAAPGASLYLSGADFPPDIEFELLIEFPGANDLISMGFALTDNAGQFQLNTTLPDLPPELTPDQLPVEAIILASSTDYLYSTSILVLPPLILMFNPNSGQPGTEVNFIVQNLSEGQLRLDYDGLPVFGPEPVTAGDFSGSFIVPFDRPVPLGGDVLLEAVNVQAGRIVAKASDYFVTVPLTEIPTYSIENVVLPDMPIEPGEAFDIGGQISPPPIFPLANYQIKVLWKDPSGKVLPITYGPSLIQPNGSFQVKARVPSFFNGDALPPDSGGEVGLVLFSQDLGPQKVIGWSPFGGFLKTPNPPPFRIRVVDSFGNPVEGAIVDIRMPGGAKVNGTQPDGGVVNLDINALNSTTNQVKSFQDGYFFPDSNNDPFTCQETALYGKTDANGYFEPQLNFDWLALAGQKTLPGYLGEGSYYQVPTEMTIPVAVNAWYGKNSLNQTGFGTYETVGGVKKPQIYKHSFVYKAIPNKYYDADNDQVVNTNPLTITLPKLPADATIGIPIKPNIPYGVVLAAYSNYAGTGIPGVAYGKYVSFSNKTDFPDALFDWTYEKGWDMRVTFTNDPLLYGSLDGTKIKLTLDGTTVIPFTETVGNSGNCDQHQYTAVVENAHRLPPGTHTMLIEAPDLSGHVNKHYLTAYFIKAPDWFRNSSLIDRRVAHHISGSVLLTAVVLDGNDLNNKATLPAYLNRVGNVNNMAGSSGVMSQSIGLSGAGAKEYEAGMPHQAINYSDTETIKSNATAPVPITFGNTIKIFESGRIPLFRDTWGVWPIASATVGADMWFDATLTYAGNIVISETAGTSSTYTKVDPEATVAIDAWLDVSALFGAVEASAHAIPQISMSLPVEFTNGVKSDSTKCFKYRLDIKWEASVGYCPFCVSDSGKKNIFAGHEPQDSELCTDPQASSVQAATPPPAANPAIANDGQGHTLAVWRAANGTILYSTFNGLAWQTPAAVTSNTSSGSSQVAYFAPNQAVAVWTQNGLTPEQASTADFPTLVKNQHLAYSLWNGTSWSAPQNLTAPTGATGEGSPVLAACLSTQTGCPAGGAVTAVWVRDVAGDLGQRQFRLFYATYQGGLWSSIQAVDSGSSATDSEPTLVYSAGTPVVLWVRDADRNLGTLTDRLAAYRYLTVAGPVVVLGDLPSGISEPSLAAAANGELRLAFTLASSAEDFTGNQRQLHSAVQTCSESCSWQIQPLTDIHGRPIHAEGPSLALDSNEIGAITYRALGFGPVPGSGPQGFPEDSLGVISGGGDIAQLKVNFISSMFKPTYLTNDAKIDWQVSASYDPLTNQFQTLAAAGTAIILNSLPDRLEKVHAENRIAAEQPVTFIHTSNLPDYVISTAEISNPHPLPGEDIFVTVRVDNIGATLGLLPDLIPLTVKAVWDGEPGVGIPAGEEVVVPIPAGQSVEFVISLSNMVNLDLPHFLNIVVNPDLNVEEGDASNNRKVIPVGGLPAPGEIHAYSGSGSSLVLLDWASVEDPRVVGYRIYRGDSEREMIPVGTTFVNGFADLTAALDRRYTYAVVSFSEDGLESDFSSLITAETASDHPMIFLPMINR